MPHKKKHAAFGTAIKEIIICTLLLFLFKCSLPPPKPFNPTSQNNDRYKDAIQYSREYLNYFLKKAKTVGMAVAVVDSNEIVYSEGFGYADRETKKKATDSTTFMIGSITKLFTGTAIMQLVEQGAVALDSPITTYLPEFKVKSRFTARQITVRDLLTHESGLPMNIYNGFFIGQLANPGVDTLYRTVPALFSNEYVTNPPMSVLCYSNIAFSLLGNIIDRVSNRTYSAYIQDSIFVKLGMNHSSVGFDDKRVSGLFSKGYLDNKEEKPFYIRDIPAGHIVTNVLDLSLFLKMIFSRGTLNNRHILGESTLKEMWTPQNTNVPLDFGRKWGLAYMLTWNSTIPSKLVGHYGYIPPYWSYFIALPDVRLGIVVLVNSSQGNPEDPADNLLKAFYVAKTGNKLPVSLPKKTQPIIKLSNKRLNELSGFYHSMYGTTIVQVNGKDLVFSFFGKSVCLVPHSDSTFSIQYKLLGLIPIALKKLQGFTFETHTVSNHKIALVRSNGSIFIIAEKFQPEKPPIEWIKRIGTYEAINKRKILYANKELERLFEQQNFSLTYDSTTKNLCMNDLSIKAISSTEAIIRGFGPIAGETILAYTENGEEYLWASGYSLRKITMPSK